MVEAPELRSIVAAAEAAAAVGDYDSAGQFLRQAAVLQETQLGPLHPDLANTLNNLGIACERAGKPVEAEECYRRAYAIVTAALAPDDPVVTTSGKNLRDFCEARGLPFELPTPATAQPSTRDAPPATIPAGAVPSSSASPTPTLLVPGSRHRHLLIGIALLSGLALLMVVTTGSWFRSGEPSPTPSPLPPPTAQTEPPAPAAPRAESVTRAPAVGGDARTTTGSPRAQAKSAEPLIVVEARVCRDFSTSTWRCTSTPKPAAPGQFFFYTRVKSARDATIRHRWFREEKLLRDVALRISANQDAGYRTYSRNTIGGERAGNWRVELRSADGSLLYEERFVVR